MRKTARPKPPLNGVVIIIKIFEIIFIHIVNSCKPHLFMQNVKWFRNEI